MHPFVLENRQKILDITASYGCTNVRVFGSMARGDATDASDVDLLVDFPQGGMGLTLFEMRQAIEDAIGRKVDIGRIEGLNQHMREHALRHAIPLHETNTPNQEGSE